MRRRHTVDVVPDDLEHYDPARWERWAAEHPEARVSPMHTAHYAYFDALLAAGVDEDVARSLNAAELVADLRRRFEGEDDLAGGPA